MKVLMLGGGGCQINAIQRLKSLGHTVILSDYLDNCIGKEYADEWEPISTFDIEKNLEVAKKHEIDGVLTLGTDQPIYTASFISKELGLSFPISPEVAKNVTNKYHMKNIFIKNNIPTPSFAFVGKDFSDDELKNINFPAVVKPVDSQGQRGVLFLNTPDEIRQNIDYVLSFSREDKIIVESYYKNDEITVNSWVYNGKVYFISVVDRVCLRNLPHIGICIAHNCPSAHLDNYRNEIIDLTNKITKIFNIQNGPIYYQYLIGKEGIKVNEIACRIGGAYEDVTIPIINGFDILDFQIKSVLGEEIDYSKLLKIEKPFSFDKYLSTQLFFAQSGTVAKLTPVEQLEKTEHVHKLYYNFKVGDTIQTIKNATQRVGYMIISGNTWDDMMTNINNTFDKLEILDSNNKNLVIPYNTYKDKYKFISK